MTGAQLGVGALLEHATMVQHDDQIGLGKGRQVMRAQHDRAALGIRLRGAEALSQGSDDLGFRVQVQGREGIVQGQQPWSPWAGDRQRPGQGDALALAAGHADAPFADVRLQARRKGA
jgi:hypothetical protein